MSDKHRTYPELPVLSLQLPNGKKEELKPMLCAEAGAEFTLTLALGVDGDIITHAYTLGLRRTLEPFYISKEQQEKILEDYSDRVRARIKLDAVLLGSDLWLRTATFKFLDCDPLVVVEPEEAWMKMASGQIRPDRVHLALTGPERVRDDT